MAIWLERRVDQIFKKNRKYKVRKKDVHITADRNGLRYLGALFLVAADAEKYDPEWHWHIPLLCRNYGKNVKTNVDLTIHAPHAYKGVCKLLGKEKRQKCERNGKKRYRGCKIVRPRKARESSG